MPKANPSPALKAMLTERNIALWDAFHYKTFESTGRHASKKDPVTVILKIPEMPDRDFHGYGRTIDEAVVSAMTFNFNRALRLRESGLVGSMAKLEFALEALADLIRIPYDIDDDVPF